MMLLVEDNPDDVFLMQAALEKAGIDNPLHTVADAETAIDYLSGTGAFADRDAYPLPAVLFLDLKLPRKSGHDVLAWMRKQDHLKGVVVLVLTGSDDLSDVNKSYALGANGYLRKPPTPDQLVGPCKGLRSVLTQAR
jgi:CheY-like chemotaxis protein